MRRRTKAAGAGIILASAGFLASFLVFDGPPQIGPTDADDPASERPPTPEVADQRTPNPRAIVASEGLEGIPGASTAPGEQPNGVFGEETSSLPPERLVITVEGERFRVGDQMYTLETMQEVLVRYREEWSNPVRVRITPESRGAAMNALEEALDALGITGIWEYPSAAPPDPAPVDPEAPSPAPSQQQPTAPPEDPDQPGDAPSEATDPDQSPPQSSGDGAAGG